METLPKSIFENAYAGQAPWDVGRPQASFVNVADRVQGSVLDSGCGTGDIALYFAERGHKVTGVDYLAEPIARAKRKATERGLSVNFLEMDALTLANLPEVFDSVIDSGLFHTFSDADQRKYVNGLASVTKPGGRLFLLCFSDAEPAGQGPKRISRQELEASFASGWVIESLEPARFEVRPDLKEIRFSEGGPKAWFLIARRSGSA